jgi:hypothetical protein
MRSIRAAGGVSENDAMDAEHSSRSATNLQTGRVPDRARRTASQLRKGSYGRDLGARPADDRIGTPETPSNDFHKCQGRFYSKAWGWAETSSGSRKLLRPHNKAKPLLRIKSNSRVRTCLRSIVGVSRATRKSCPGTDFQRRGTEVRPRSLAFSSPRTPYRGRIFPKGAG